MDFRTVIKIPKSDIQIDYSDKVMLFGSCFTESIGSKLSDSKIDTSVNPFGVLYNPYSIAQAIERLISGTNFGANDLIFKDDLYQSFWHHSKFSNPDKNECLNKIQTSFSDASERLKSVNFFIITFGTAYTYKVKSSKQIVGNCHKFPADYFERECLSINDIEQQWTSVIENILRVNPNARFIFTVSPIRHWKDGAHENVLSKSILHLSIDRLQRRFTNEVSYFCAYEILLDELRDYRFYAEDMMHPSPQAIDYIWQRFSETYFNNNTLTFINEWNKTKKSLTHKPLNAQSATYNLFLKKTLQIIETLQQKYTRVSFEKEIEYLKDNLSK